MKLAALAEANGASLLFEAAVAAASPRSAPCADGLAGIPITDVLGIMNGTCNYILTEMERGGRSFADCLADAQRLGYAEADPTFDVDGFDTAHKLAILSSIAFTTEIDASAVRASKASAPSSLPTSRPPKNSASASSFSASRR